MMPWCISSAVREVQWFSPFRASANSKPGRNLKERIQNVENGICQHNDMCLLSYWNLSWIYLTNFIVYSPWKWCIEIFPIRPQLIDSQVAMFHFIGVIRCHKCFDCTARRHFHQKWLSPLCTLCMFGWTVVQSFRRAKMTNGNTFKKICFSMQST